MDENTVLVCDKCSAKLRVRTTLLKVMKTVKCTRCGAAVSTKPKPPEAAAPPHPHRPPPRQRHPCHPPA
jgi:DNA-directed RNA polymerase subunit RPC12/RpoP